VPANAAGVTLLLRLGQIGFLGSTQRILGAFAIRDVVVGLERRGRIPAVGSLERPPACDDDLCPVALRVQELPLPAPGAEQRFRDLIERRGEDGLQELVRHLAECFFSFPPVELLRSAIPVRNHIIHAPDQDRVVYEIK
jgi:hypothetical protein